MSAAEWEATKLYVAPIYPRRPNRLVQRIEDHPGWTVEVPLAGLGIGQQIASLKANRQR